MTAPATSDEIGGPDGDPALARGAGGLPRANAIFQGTIQLTVFVGPALAGILIAAAAASQAAPSYAGVGSALVADAVSFLASLATLMLIRGRPHVAPPRESVLDEIAAGVRYTWASPNPGGYGALVGDGRRLAAGHVGGRPKPSASPNTSAKT
jgi:hypothetical protein